MPFTRRLLALHVRPPGAIPPVAHRDAAPLEPGQVERAVPWAAAPRAGASATYSAVLTGLTAAGRCPPARPRRRRPRRRHRRRRWRGRSRGGQSRSSRATRAAGEVDGVGGPAELVVDDGRGPRRGSRQPQHGPHEVRPVAEEPARAHDVVPWATAAAPLPGGLRRAVDTLRVRAGRPPDAARRRRREDVVGADTWTSGRSSRRACHGEVGDARGVESHAAARAPAPRRASTAVQAAALTIASTPGPVVGGEAPAVGDVEVVRRRGNRPSGQQRRSARPSWPSPPVDQGRQRPLHGSGRSARRRPAAGWRDGRLSLRTICSRGSGHGTASVGSNRLTFVYARRGDQWAFTR